MGWKQNKFDSDKGQEYIGKIFDMIFAEPMFESNKIETVDLDRQVSHFKNNMLSIVNLMKKFVVGYSEVPMSEAVSTGIQVCPHCRRRDFIWNWEITDVGHYASPEDWVSSVEPKEWKIGLPHEKNRYLFMARYKCNHVTTCNKCKATTIGHHSKCGNPECNSTDVVKAGCNRESYGKHFIREYTAKNNHPTSLKARQNMVLRNKEVRKDRKNRKEGQIVGYQYVRRMPMKGTTILDYDEALQYMPYVQFTYGATFDDGEMKTKEVKYPFSELNFALSKQRVKVCRNGLDNCHQGHRNELSEGAEICTSSHYRVNSSGFLSGVGGTRCGASMPPTIVEEGYYYSPSIMSIMAEQPLGEAAMSGRTKNGEPVFFIHLKSPVENSDYQILLPLPMIESLAKIPDAPEPIISASSPPSCPNDIGMATMIEDLTVKAKESMEETKSLLTEQLKKYFDLGPADGNTSEGFSFVICEGRSRHAILEDDNWIDKSPKCLIEGNTYARWNEIPNYADPDSTATEYLGPNPNSHFVQDWLKASDQIVSFVSNPPVYHFVDGIGEMVRETEGVIIDIMECETCKGIVEAKGIIPYRQNLNQCDENGVAINGFSQEVLDAEIEYQKSYPMENELGEKVPTAWGITASRNHDGKDMLRRITKYKFD